MTDITDIGESFWTTVWSDIKNGGTPFFIMLLLFVVWTCKKYIGDFLNLILEQLKLKTKNKSKTYTKKDVMNHPIFRDLEFWLSSGIDSIKMLNTFICKPMIFYNTFTNSSLYCIKNFSMFFVEIFCNFSATN